jgi:uncharacterized protein (DUF2141 family)
MKSFIFCGLVICLSAGIVKAQGNLTVNVSGFKNSKGMCKLWVYNSADGWPSNEKKAYKIVEVPITGSGSVCVFKNLPAGTYAISAIHDENGNHKFDMNLFGIPKEAYGNTNGIRGGIGGAPKYDQVKITVPENGLTVAIVVK